MNEVNEVNRPDQPIAVIVFYSFTSQTKLVTNSIADELQNRGWDVRLTRIIWEDDRYHLNIPLVPFWRKMALMILPQLLHKTGKFRLEGDVDLIPDLVLIGSPTWWLNPAMPVVSFLKSKSAGKLLSGRNFAVFTVCRALWKGNYRWVRKQSENIGGRFLAHQEFCFLGNQIQSFLAFVFKLKSDREPKSWLKIPMLGYGVGAKVRESSKKFVNKLTEGP